MRPSPGAEALTGLLDEVRLTFHRLTRLADAAHAPREVAAAGRAVMEFLSREGEATVPRIAEARGVTRQHIQTIANELIERGLVERRVNPVHARSWLLALTAEGQEVFAAVVDEESGLLEEASSAVAVADLEAATRTLRAVRGELGALTGRFDPQRSNPKRKEDD